MVGAWCLGWCQVGFLLLQYSVLCTVESLCLLYLLYILIYMFLEIMHWWAWGLSCKPNIYVSWSTSELRVRLAPSNRFMPTGKIVLLTVPRRYIFCGSFVFLCLVFLMLSRLLIATLWSPAGKGLTFWLLLMMFIVFLLLSHVVFWVSCGTYLYLFLIFAVFLTLTI